MSAEGLSLEPFWANFAQSGLLSHDSGSSLAGILRLAFVAGKKGADLPFRFISLRKIRGELLIARLANAERFWRLPFDDSQFAFRHRVLPSPTFRHESVSHSRRPPTCWSGSLVDRKRHRVGSFARRVAAAAIGPPGVLLPGLTTVTCAMPAAASPKPG